MYYQTNTGWFVKSPTYFNNRIREVGTNRFELSDLQYLDVAKDIFQGCIVSGNIITPTRRLRHWSCTDCLSAKQLFDGSEPYFIYNATFHLSDLGKSSEGLSLHRLILFDIWAYNIIETDTKITYTRKEY